jgi:hypothetical protein
MASHTVFQAVRDHLAAAFTACPLVYPNEGDGAPNPPAPWIFVEVVGALYDQESIGAGSVIANRWRETGLVVGNVMVPRQTGTVLQREIAMLFLDAFRGASLLGGHLVFERASPGAGAAGDDNGRWWCMTATVEFDYTT